MRQLLPRRLCSRARCAADLAPCSRQPRAAKWVPHAPCPCTGRTAGRARASSRAPTAPRARPAPTPERSTARARRRRRAPWPPRRAGPPGGQARRHTCAAGCVSESSSRLASSQPACRPSGPDRSGQPSPGASAASPPGTRRRCPPPRAWCPGSRTRHRRPQTRRPPWPQGLQGHRPHSAACWRHSRAATHRRRAPRRCGAPPPPRCPRQGCTAAAPPPRALQQWWWWANEWHRRERR